MVGNHHCADCPRGECVGSASRGVDGRKWPLRATAFPEAIYSMLPSCVVTRDHAGLQGSPRLYNTAFYLNVSVKSRFCVSNRKARLTNGPDCGRQARAANLHT